MKSFLSFLLIIASVAMAMNVLSDDHLTQGKQAIFYFSFMILMMMAKKHYDDSLIENYKESTKS